ncbi:copper amine oxidase N-terminal domain-containing protein [Fenollaria massiliensis]|uniref:Copper amine oxidase N-terminal domain-containing protein n=1 Tax=Fenollaria massiliensis TaxID=938288 RepID=A0A9E7IWK1_9FIRM|nr:copper amine oxidase N-terminal domain-containing protein [Fenollaria massiliensis]UQK58930.1 copper amine oxidase N-terminal domain-containing protein [Fenollaria massiliensis]
MKKKISLLLAILMLVTLIPTSFAERKIVDAKKNNQRIALDGEEVKVGTYLVEDYTYIKLRDVAALLNETPNQFDIGFATKELKTIVLALGEEYEKEDDDLQEIKKEKAKASVGVIQVKVNGELKDLKTALIDGFNYVQLRDLSKLVGFEVGYDAKNKTILINTKEDENSVNANKNKVPKSKWTEAEKEWFKNQKTYLNNMVLLIFGFATADSPNIEQIKQKYLDNLGLSVLGGRKLFQGSITDQSNRVEIRDGIRYAIATLVYESGATVVYEGQNIGQENEFWRTNFYNTVILTIADKLPEKYMNDKNAVCEQIVKFYDAIVNKDYEKAVKEIKELKINATVESVKLFEERMKEYANGVEIFRKDYTTVFKTDENGDPHVFFQYSDNTVFEVAYIGTNSTGILAATRK